MNQSLLRREEEDHLPFESRKLEIRHIVPKRDPSRAKSRVGRGGQGCLGNRWELGDMRGHQPPVVCKASSMTRSLGFCLSVEGRELLRH